MKNNIRMILFIASILMTIASHALVIETDNFSVLLDYADEDTLIILDIDNTIARPKQELGSDEWFCYSVNQKMAQGYDYYSAIHLTLPTAYYVTFHIPLMLTDEYLPSLIASLKEKNINVIALTSRGMYLAERTHEQLKDINILFHLLLANNDKDLLLYLTNPCLYRYNILFTGNNDKGQTLFAFLNILNYHPKKVIFVDDKMYHVKSIEASLEHTDIEYIGIRYAGCDHYVHDFDHTKAEDQWKALRNLAL